MTGQRDDDSLRIVQTAAPVRQMIVDTLRQAIFELRFRPGEHLVERELCELIGVSRTSLREALRQLEGEGLVEIVPNKGPRVFMPTLDQAREIYEAREVLESHAGGVAAERASEADIRALKRVPKRLAAAIRANDRMGVIEAKAEFYATVLGCGGNREIAEILRKLIGRLTLVWPTMIVRSSESERVIAEVEGMVAAVAARDSDRARATFAEHIRSAHRMTADFIGAAEG